MSYDLPSPRQEITLTAGTAFKLGFFGFFGAFVASLIVSIIVFAVLLVIGLVLGATATGIINN